MVFSWHDIRDWKCLIVSTQSTSISMEIIRGEKREFCFRRLHFFFYVMVALYFAARSFVDGNSDGECVTSAKDISVYFFSLFFLSL